MKCYAGLDISQNETAICVLDETGLIVREQKVITEPEALICALRACNVSFERVGLEACPLSEWLFAELTAEGLPAICFEVRRLRATLSGLINKTDKNDARGIAQVMRTGWFKAVHVKSRRPRNFVSSWQHANPHLTVCRMRRTSCVALSRPLG
jgi:transposase